MMREDDGLDGARRNLRLYPLYIVGASFFAWMPVFFLYFSARLELSDVLLLEAIYYGCVVLFEVPSGYFSDRFGRRSTLIIAAACLVGAYASFIVSSSFMGLAFGQALLALGLALNSGTDTSFHLDNLEALGRGAQYEQREARLSSLMFVTNSLAAFVGGAAALVDMRLAYALSLVGALFALGAAASFQQLHVELDEVPASFMVSLRRCAALAWSPRLGWFFAATVVATITNHIPYEFYQPYLEQLEGAPWEADTTPWIAGLHLSLVQVVAAPVAASSSWVSRRLGLVPSVLGSMLLQVLLIASMTWWISPWVALLLVGRSIPGAL
jgi:MFS family permease